MKIFKIAEFWKIFILYFTFHILYYDTQHIKQKSFEDMSLSITVMFGIVHLGVYSARVCHLLQ